MTGGKGVVVVVKETLKISIINRVVEGEHRKREKSRATTLEMVGRKSCWRVPGRMAMLR